MNSFCPLQAKNTFILVLANFFYKAIFTVFTPNRGFLAIFEVDVEPSVCQLFEVDDHGDAGNDDLSHHNLPNFKQL